MNKEAKCLSWLNLSCMAFQLISKFSHHTFFSVVQSVSPPKTRLSAQFSIFLLPKDVYQKTLKSYAKHLYILNLVIPVLLWLLTKARKGHRGRTRFCLNPSSNRLPYRTESADIRPAVIHWTTWLNSMQRVCSSQQHVLYLLQSFHLELHNQHKDN